MQTHLVIPDTIKAILITALLSASLQAQAGVRYVDKIFPETVLKSDIQYGESIAYDGQNVKLLLDIYSPANDTARNRPLIVFIHGGGFKSNDKVGRFNRIFSEAFARRGYVVSSINYRLSPKSISESEDYFKAMYRAVQDAKAAIRFLRGKSSLYKIDADRIFVAGTSAGAMTALHLAYMNQNEVPSFIDTAVIGNIEGECGEQGISSKVNGVVNLWGAMWDINWLNDNDVPVFSVHGTGDKVVPFDSSYSYHGFKYGSKIIHKRAVSRSVKSGLRLFPNAGHTLDNDSLMLENSLDEIASWMYPLVMPAESINLKNKEMRKSSFLTENFKTEKRCICLGNIRNEK